MGGVLVGTPDLNTDTIIKSVVSAPAIDAMGTVRGDWQISNQDVLTTRYSVEQLGATGASFLDFGSSSFGAPVTTAGDVFGSGRPRALQLALRFSF